MVATLSPVSLRSVQGGSLILRVKCGPVPWIRYHDNGDVELSPEGGPRDELEPCALMNWATDGPQMDEVRRTRDLLIEKLEPDNLESYGDEMYQYQTRVQVFAAAGLLVEGIIVAYLEFGHVYQVDGVKIGFGYPLRRDLRKLVSEAGAYDARVWGKMTRW